MVIILYTLPFHVCTSSFLGDCQQSCNEAKTGRQHSIAKFSENHGFRPTKCDWFAIIVLLVGQSHRNLQRTIHGNAIDLRRSREGRFTCHSWPSIALPQGRLRGSSPQKKLLPRIEHHLVQQDALGVPLVPHAIHSNAVCLDRLDVEKLALNRQQRVIVQQHGCWLLCVKQHAIDAPTFVDSIDLFRHHCVL